MTLEGTCRRSLGVAEADGLTDGRVGVGAVVEVAGAFVDSVTVGAACCCGAGGVSSAAPPHAASNNDAETPVASSAMRRKP